MECFPEESKQLGFMTTPNFIQPKKARHLSSIQLLKQRFSALGHKADESHVGYDSGSREDPVTPGHPAWPSAAGLKESQMTKDASV